MGDAKVWYVWLKVTRCEGGVNTEGIELQDIVFFDKSCSQDYVYNSLVEHDGFDPNIKIESKPLP